MRPVLLLATLETKSEESGYLRDALACQGITARMVDISLSAGSEIRDPGDKLRRMEEVAKAASAQIAGQVPDVAAAIGLGGGTGGEIALRILRTLPFGYPKFLITTLPFDPRVAVADNSIVVIPTVADIEGMNSSLRQILDNTARMLVGPAMESIPVVPARKSVGLSTLGTTRKSARAIIDRLRRAGHEVTAFHANGYGGAALARFARGGEFVGTIDMTVHEITRMYVAGAHACTTDRFTAAGHLPRVVLPGGLNFIGLGEIDQVDDSCLARPHYRHTGYFTHVKMSVGEMELACTELAAALNRAAGHTEVILPMGGFSHEDCPGGAIEDRSLREIAARVLEDSAAAYATTRLDAHINDDKTAELAVGRLLLAMQEGVPDD